MFLCSRENNWDPTGANTGAAKEPRMNVGVLGTGIVGQTIAGKVASLGHDVRVGTRDVDALLARTEPAPTGAPPFSE